MSQYRTKGESPRRSAGFTLVELMIVIAVLAILALVAMPAMTAMLNNSQVNGQASELTSALQLARSEAIRRNATVRVCASTNGSTCASSADWTGWILRGRDNTTGTDDVIRSTTAGARVNVTGPSAGIVFKPSGLLDSQACLMVVSKAADSQRRITVLVSGVVTSSNSGTCS